jgi:hypothetical protein
MTFRGLSKDRCSDLLFSLLSCIFDNFRACSYPEKYLERVLMPKNNNPRTQQKVTLVGAKQGTYRTEQYYVDYLQLRT